MGSIYWGERCKECNDFKPRAPGVLDLGVYR